MVEAGAAAAPPSPTRPSRPRVPRSATPTRLGLRGHLKVQRPSRRRWAALRKARCSSGMLDPHNNKSRSAYGKAGHRRLLDGAPAAHDAPQAWTGSSQANTRLQGPGRPGGGLQPGDADDDDRRRHGDPAKVFVVGAGVAGLQAIATARRMGAWSPDTDVRGVQGGDREPRRQVRGPRAGGRRHQGRLRAGADGRGAGRAGEDGGRAPEDPGHRRHHRADPGPEGAPDRHHGDGAGDEAGCGHPRHGGRERRQRRGQRGRPVGRGRRRHPRGCPEPRAKGAPATTVHSEEPAELPPAWSTRAATSRSTPTTS